MTRHDVRVSFREGFPPETRIVWTPWTETSLENAIRRDAGNISFLEFIEPAGEAREPRPGDVVQVSEGRFRGCILTLIDITPGNVFICRNDTLGEWTPQYRHPIIRTRAVEFVR